MNKYDIWIEGFRSTGHCGRAMLLAKDVEADNFLNACIKARDDGAFEGYGAFNTENITLWGCSLFSNEEEAREGFG